ncbi:unnamed protein product [Scytosiphon promiscuus]
MAGFGGVGRRSRIPRLGSISTSRRFPCFLVYLHNPPPQTSTKLAQRIREVNRSVVLGLVHAALLWLPRPKRVCQPSLGSLSWPIDGTFIGLARVAFPACPVCCTTIHSFFFRCVAEQTP